MAVSSLTLAVVSKSRNAGTAVSTRNYLAVKNLENPTGIGNVAASKVKFTSPDLFKGDHNLLRTWLFHMNEYTELCGITISTEKSQDSSVGIGWCCINLVGVSPN